MGVVTILLGLLLLTPIVVFAEGNVDGRGSDPGAPYGPGDAPREIHPLLLLVEVLSHAPRDDEYMVVANPGWSPVNLTGWTLTDGEGSWGLPALWLNVGASILVTRNGTSLWEDGGLRADGCVVGCDRRIAVRGSLALRNEGDSLHLLNPEGGVVDALLYGQDPPLLGWEGEPVPSLPRGLVARRRVDDNGWVDSDAATDWAWSRTFRLGQSRSLPPFFENVPIRPLLSPEDSLASLLALVRHAQNRVDLAGFTLTNTALVGALRDVLDRGVRVQIGVEESPPGGVGVRGEEILRELQKSGARVLLMGSHGEGAWRRYALHHAKYLLIDQTWVVLGSENFSPNGYPSEAGNRGWGVAARSPGLARWFGEVFRRDWDENRSDIRSPSRSGEPRGNEVVQPADPPRPTAWASANVTAFLGPDNAEEGLLGLLRHATESIDVELFYLRWWWNGGTNPFVVALLAAAARGVTVRVLLDGRSYNVEGDEDNDEAVRRLNQMGAMHGHRLEARIFPGDTQRIVKLHNKGVLVDGRRAWVSSMNWNLAGAFANREAGLLVDSGEVAAVFQRAFEEDWEAGQALGGPLPGGEPERVVFLGIGLASGAAAGAWWWVLRTTKEATNKHPRKERTWRRRSKQPTSPSRRRRSRSTRTARSTGGFTGRASGPRARRP
ncbi:MAG: phospholipase D-like domain-containing protein [Thermoplasmata archaeon]